MGVIKVYHLSPELVKDSEMIDGLYNMIRDREPQVRTPLFMLINRIDARSPLAVLVVEHSALPLGPVH